MSKYEYKTIDGEKVEKNVAIMFERMAKAFKRQFGLELLITSGTRTREEQEALYKKYLSGTGHQAARPGWSRHEEENGYGIGPVALDLRDSGKDAGVKYIGTKRNNWLSKNCHKWGFVHAGKTFKNPEGWHFEGVNCKRMLQAEAAKEDDNDLTQVSKSTSSKASPNKYGLDNVEGLQKISTRYSAPGKRTAIDNKWGDLSQAGFDNFLDKEYGGHLDAGLAAWLRAKYGYKGDDKYGPNMKAALERANEANKSSKALTN